MDHELEFQRIKKILADPAILRPFDVNLKTDLLVDAAKLYGLGWALTQYWFEPDPDKPGKMIERRHVVECGCCSQTDTA